MSIVKYDVHNIDLHEISSVMFLLMIRRPPRSTLERSSAASDVYKRQVTMKTGGEIAADVMKRCGLNVEIAMSDFASMLRRLSLIHISEPTRPY